MRRSRLYSFRISSIKKDLESGDNAATNEKTTVVAGQRPIPYKSHPDIKLFRSTEHDARTFYFDAKGNKYSMKPDGKLILFISVRIVKFYRAYQHNNK